MVMVMVSVATRVVVRVVVRVMVRVRISYRRALDLGIAGPDLNTMSVRDRSRVGVRDRLGDGTL